MTNTTETISLLTNTIYVTPQAFATDIKFPCTGFCYMILDHLDDVIHLYRTRNIDGYQQLIFNTILAAAKRKQDNPYINDDGEYLDRDTIVADFKHIVDTLTFKEFNTVNEESLAFAQNTIFLELIDMSILKYIMVIRSHETFIMIKLDSNSFLVIDSHKTKHGTVTIATCV